MNTTRYEETAALVAEKKARIEPLIAELRTLPPFPDDAVSLAACKPTIGDMRRNATRLRAGKLRPRDPDADPIDVAGRLEKGARWLEVLEALALEFFDTAARLQVMIDDAEAEVYAACVTTFLDANNSPKSPGARSGRGSRPWSTHCGGRKGGVEGRRAKEEGRKGKGEGGRAKEEGRTRNAPHDVELRLAESEWTGLPSLS